MSTRNPSIAHLSFLVAAFLATRAPLTIAAEVLPEVVILGKETKRAGGYNPNDSHLTEYGGEPLSDIPQSITSVPEQLMQDQAATTLREALRNVSGLSISAGEGGSQGDSLTLRGFSARSDIYLDGMRDSGNYFRDAFNLGAVDSVKGPSSILFGRGSTGGIINQISKAPIENPITSGAVLFGNDLTRRAAIDVGRPIGEHSAFRLNVMAHESDISGRDTVENRRAGIAPSLSFGLGTSTRLTLAYLHQTENDIPDYGIPFLLGEVAPVDRANFYGFKHANFFRASIDVATVKLERDFNPNLTLRNQTRYGNYERQLQTSAPRIAGTPTAATPLDSIAVNRSQVAVDGREQTIDNDLSLAAKFGTGALAHHLVVGTEMIRESTAPTRYSFTDVPGTSLLWPSPDDSFSGTGTISSRAKGSLVTLAGYALDTIRFNDRLGISGGARFDRMIGRYEQTIGTAPGVLTRKDDQVSWRGSAAYKPSEAGIFYFSYGTAFNPSIEQVSLSASTVNLDPEKNETYEVGSKWDYLGGRFSLQSALFRTEKTNARTPDPANPALNVLSGRHRVDGIETSVSGSPAPRLGVFAGYTYLYARVIETTRAGEIGNLLGNVPRSTANLWLSYDLTDRLQLGAGMNVISQRPVATTPDAATGAPRKVDGYSIYSAMAKYRVSMDFDLQLNLSNLGNTYNYDAVYAGHAVPGAGRTALLGANFRM